MIHVPFINSYYHLSLKTKKIASCRVSKAMTLAKLKLGQDQAVIFLTLKAAKYERYWVGSSRVLHCLTQSGAAKLFTSSPFKGP
jgi:hypothetical protein